MSFLALESAQPWQVGPILLFHLILSSFVISPQVFIPPPLLIGLHPPVSSVLCFRGDWFLIDSLFPNSAHFCLSQSVMQY